MALGQPKDWQPSSRLGYVRVALMERCRNEHDWCLSWWGRVRYTAKLIVCALFLPARSVYCNWPLDHIEVAHWGGGRFSGPDGTYYTWHVLAVGHGWRNWRWEATTDGD